ncbi:unnamed protein product [Rodentolepis nana]|uniref:Uncharacterized protein n=1 Tax=Rodentolepis nana TaxID=102285 RepID=A0A3P7SSP2_RODNA|nr:unnamed protein product [Rodentolepis nana]
MYRSVIQLIAMLTTFKLGRRDRSEKLLERTRSNIGAPAFLKVSSRSRKEFVRSVTVSTADRALKSFSHAFTHCKRPRKSIMNPSHFEISSVISLLSFSYCLSVSSKMAF